MKIDHVAFFQAAIADVKANLKEMREELLDEFTLEELRAAVSYWETLTEIMNDELKFYKDIMDKMKVDLNKN